MAFWDNWKNTGNSGTDGGETVAQERDEVHQVREFNHQVEGQAPTVEITQQENVSIVADKTRIVESSNIEEEVEKEQTLAEKRNGDAGLDEIVSDMEANAKRQQEGKVIHAPGAGADEGSEASKGILEEKEPEKSVPEEVVGTVSGDISAKVNQLDIVGKDLGVQDEVVNTVEQALALEPNTEFAHDADDIGGKVAGERAAEHVAEQVVEETVAEVSNTREVGFENILRQMGANPLDEASLQESKIEGDIHPRSDIRADGHAPNVGNLQSMQDVLNAHKHN